MTDRGRVKQLFLRGRELPFEVRQAWLAAECDDDAALCREVESLLAAEDGMPVDFLRAPEVGAAPSLTPGSTLSRYRIVELLGEGGMGEVYLARDEQLDRDVAVKVLPTFATGDEAARSRLLREARAAAALNHPHICTIHEVNEADGRIYLVLERLEGQTLDAVIPRGGLPLEQVLRYGTQIADALAHAHQRGVVHRDLKPGNVIVTPRGHAKVLDFGIAKRVARSHATEAPTVSARDSTEQHTFVGTPPYMAPEQLRGEAIDSRCDVWALGLLLYEMATGERPFRGRTGPELSAVILGEPPRPLPERVPNRLRVVVERCLEKDPRRRYESGDDALSALAALGVGSARPRWLTLGRSSGSIFRWRPAVVLTVVAVALAVALAVLRIIDAQRRHGESAATSSPPLNAIAVLPFSSVDPDARDELMELGLADTLIARLSAASSLRVRALASARRFADPDRDPLEAGRRLGADYVVEGSTQRHGERVRVNARLLDVRDGTTLWSGTFDETADRVFTLQDAIAAGIAAALEIGTARRGAPTPCSGADAEAYRAFLVGRYQIGRLDPDRLQAAQAAYRRAIDLDPSCARAYAGLSWTYRALTVVTESEPREPFALARAAAEQAIAIDPEAAEGYAQRGFVEVWHDWNWEAARASFRRAAALDPSLPETYLGEAQLDVTLGRLDAAEEHALQLQRLDPLSPLLNSLSADILRTAGRIEAAERAIERALELEPGYWHALLIRGRIALDRGDPRGAIADFERAAAAAGGNSLVLALLSRARAAGGDVDGARSILAALESRARSSYVPARSLALAHLAVGEAETALDHLERAFDEREWGLFSLNIDNQWNALRDFPRFRALTERLALPAGRVDGRL